MKIHFDAALVPGRARPGRTRVLDCMLAHEAHGRVAMYLTPKRAAAAYY